MMIAAEAALTHSLALAQSNSAESETETVRAGKCPRQQSMTASKLRIGVPWPFDVDRSVDGIRSSNNEVSWSCISG